MGMRTRWWVAPVLLAVASQAAAQGGDWTTYGGNDWNQRYSKLKTINTSNVAQLVPRMIFQTGIAKLGSFENTPIVSNGMMYVTTPYNTAMAYDLNTKKEVWRYEHKLGTTIFCCGPNNRGVAIHGGEHLYMGTLDAHLVALEAKTGKVMWDKEVADPAFGYSITHAPLIVGDNVIVGVSGGEYGIRGHVTAYNAATGDQVWRWYSIPAPSRRLDGRRQGPQRLDRHLGHQGRRRRPPSRHRQGEGRQRQVRRCLEDRWRRRVDDALVRQGVEHDLRDRRQPVARPRRQHLVRATTCTPTASWRSTPPRARPSGTTRLCPMTSGTSTRRPRRS